MRHINLTPLKLAVMLALLGCSVRRHSGAPIISGRSGVTLASAFAYTQQSRVSSRRVRLNTSVEHPQIHTAVRSGRCMQTNSIHKGLALNNGQRALSSAHFSTSSDADSSDSGFYADKTSHPDFASLGIQNEILLERLSEMKMSFPSAVQAEAYHKISSPESGTRGNVIIGAETGSGKTLAYLLPLVDDILTQKKDNALASYDYCRAIILVPNKELCQQVLRMASGICGGLEKCMVWGGSFGENQLQREQSQGAGSAASDIVRIAVLPGGLDAPIDFKPFRDSVGLGGSDPPVDLVICTPAALGPMGLTPKCIDFFADIQTLVVDEADMLLDGGYLRQLENSLLGFRRADRLDDGFGLKKTQHVFVGATLPDYGLKSVNAYITKKFPDAVRVNMPGLHNAMHYGLKDRTIWIQDDEAENKKARMEKVVSMLLGNDEEGNSLVGEKVMVFLNSVDDVDGATNAFRRAGIEAVPYHAKIPLAERATNLDQFRQYSAESDDENDSDGVPVLVCTDLASRGLDIPGVTAIVQLQFAGNVVAHLHRMGRCGRAGKKDGRGVIFFSEMEKKLVDVVREAEFQQKQMVLEGDVQESQEEGRGTVKNAFSRKRGFTKKFKKIARESREEGSY